MACSNCLYDLCDVLVCDGKAQINLPATTLQSGVHKIVLEYLHTAKVYEIDIMSGSDIDIEIECLNENYCYEGYIVQPDNTPLMIIDDAIYSGFKFCTKQIQVCL